MLLLPVDVRSPRHCRRHLRQSHIEVAIDPHAGHYHTDVIAQHVSVAHDAAQPLRCGHGAVEPLYASGAMAAQAAGCS